MSITSIATGLSQDWGQDGPPPYLKAIQIKLEQPMEVILLANMPFRPGDLKLRGNFNQLVDGTTIFTLTRAMKIKQGAVDSLLTDDGVKYPASIASGTTFTVLYDNQSHKPILHLDNYEGSSLDLQFHYMANADYYLAKLKEDKPRRNEIRTRNLELHRSRSEGEIRS